MEDQMTDDKSYLSRLSERYNLLQTAYWRLDEEVTATARVLGDFMLVPPDGGDLKLHEGAQAMKDALDAAIAERDELRSALEMTRRAAGFPQDALTNDIRAERDAVFAERDKLRQILSGDEGAKAVFDKYASDIQAYADAADAAIAGRDDLRMHLAIFTSHYELWMHSHSPKACCPIAPRHTFGQLFAARAALTKDTELQKYTRANEEDQ
jgi:hypothetical protein